MMNNYFDEEKECIIVIEDYEYLNNFVSSNLRKKNYDVIQCFNKQDAIEKLATTFPSLVILDLNLGNESGMDVLKTIRRQNNDLPVMIISSLSDKDTKLEGFRNGCDDYITKPFYIEELYLRINRMLLKSNMTSNNPTPIKSVYKSGVFEINVEEGILTKNGTPIRLRKKQLDLMLYFIQNPNRILSLKSIYESVWRKPAPEDKKLESNIYVNIKALREAIEQNSNNPAHILSASKAGYIFVPN